MRMDRRWTCLWPGLPELWEQGAWSGLALAAGFALLLNLSLAITLVWTEWAGPEVRVAAWTGVVGLWSVAGIGNWRRIRSPEPAAARDLFSQAVNEYLLGNWYNVEKLLGKLLKLDRHDVDAHLLLATLFRHAGRHDEARQTLARLQQLAGHEKWELEIGREFELLNEAEAEVDEPATIPLTKNETETHPSHAARAA